MVAILVEVSLDGDQWHEGALRRLIRGVNDLKHGFFIDEFKEFDDGWFPVRLLYLLFLHLERLLRSLDGSEGLGNNDVAHKVEKVEDITPARAHCDRRLRLPGKEDSRFWRNV